MTSSDKVDVRLDDETIEQLDALVERGVYPCRSVAVREALGDLLNQHTIDAGERGWS